jgi:TRAP-type C4-dicarboxylate transport system permease small subunit
MDAVAGIIVALGTIGFAIALAWFGFKLLTTGTQKETTIIKLGSFELTLSTLVGGVLILGAVFAVVTLLNKFYPK